MILKEIVDLIEKAVIASNKKYQDINVLELGNQIMKWHPKRTGKEYLLFLGVKQHFSIDLNGRDGALKIDLSKPITQWQKGYFDLITNYGTAEHVQDGIYQCYKNIHDLTKQGGAMINAGPIAGGCPNHSPYHYEPWFFEKLAEKNGYKIIVSESRVCQGRSRNQPEKDRTLVCSVLVKEHDTDFITNEEFLSINGIEGLK